MSIVDRILGDVNPGGTTDEGDPLESRLDDLFTALANPRRRFIIDNLGDREDDEWVTAGELTDGLAFIENDHLQRVGDASTEERKRVYVGLTQTHFQRLDEWGLLEYDDQAKAVRKTAGTMVAQRLLRAGYREVSNGEGWYA